MPCYRALRKVWISHECRMVDEGEQFDTVFPPGPNGQPMRLGDTLVEVHPDDAQGVANEEGPRRKRRGASE